MLKNQQSKRQIECAKMLEEALSRPGVREAMEVYEKYRSLQERNKKADTSQSHFTEPEGKARVASSTASNNLEVNATAHAFTHSTVIKIFENHMDRAFMRLHAPAAN